MTTNQQVGGSSPFQRTKKVIRYLYLMTFLLCCESVREYSLFRGPHKVKDFVGRGGTYEVIVGKRLHFALITECVSTRVPSSVPKSPKWICPLWTFYYFQGCRDSNPVIQNLTHHRTADFERRNIRSVCYDFAPQNCLNTECVSTSGPFDTE